MLESGRAERGSGTGGFAIGVGAWRLGGQGSAPQYAEQATRAEALGFHSLWVPENHFGDASSLPAPLLLLATAAAVTRRIRLGTGSFLLPLRHPVQMAEEVAVLDRLSEGRVILGVGRGYLPSLFRAYDIPAPEKRARFEEALARMQAAWRGEPVAEGDGQAPVRLAPLPVQRPHPPVWVAAFGPRALEQAGRLGLPYLASPIESLDLLAENHARHREAAEAAGQTLPPGLAVMRTTFVSTDRSLLARVREALGRQARDFASSPLAAFRRAGGARTEDWTLVGEPARVGEQIARYRERLPVTLLIATRTRLPAVPTREIERSLEHLAELGETLGEAQGAQSSP